MTNFTKNVIMAAAAVLVSAGMAGAQTIKAEVPFGFHAAGKTLPAGAYTVSASHLGGGSLIFRLTNQDTRRTVVTAPYSQSSLKSGEKAMWLAFQCTGDNCALTQIAVGTGQRYQLPQAKGSSEDSRVALIQAVLVSAE